MYGRRTSRACIGGCAAALSLAGAAAGAAPQRLDCMLTDTDTETAVEQRRIAIVFDEEASTLLLDEAGRTRSLANVSIGMTSISGGEANLTVGVSRSSWRVVLQTYQKSSVRTEYGTCAKNAVAAPAPKTPSPRGH